MLHTFIVANFQKIVARTQAKIALQTSPMPTETELKNGVPLFLTQLIDRLRLTTSNSGAIEESAALHGGELLAMGFTVSQVVHTYGDICQVIMALAAETDARITANEFHIFNRCLDDAIAHAVTEYQRQRDESVARDGAERLGIVAHELRNRLHTAMLAFRFLQDGTVGFAGSTSAALSRNLRAMRDTIDMSLSDVRLDAGLRQLQRVSVSGLIADTEVDGSLEAEFSGLVLAVSPVEHDIDVEADVQLLGAAVGNLLQNAFKFSHRHGVVKLRATATADRVTIEVEDQCGGLPPGKAEEMFRPFEQRGAIRSGVGLGLSICRKSVEAMGGEIRVQNLPGMGCVFSIELPRLLSPANYPIKHPPRESAAPSGRV